MIPCTCEELKRSKISGICYKHDVVCMGEREMDLIIQAIECRGVTQHSGKVVEYMGIPVIVSDTITPSTIEFKEIK